MRYNHIYDVIDVDAREVMTSDLPVTELRQTPAFIHLAFMYMYARRQKNSHRNSGGQVKTALSR